jgi:hypothetical protein
MRDVEIQDLVLRIPGVSATDARWIGARIAERLASSIAGWRDVDLPSLAVRVHIAAGSSREAIVAEVSAAIARSLR